MNRFFVCLFGLFLLLTGEAFSKADPVKALATSQVAFGLELFKAVAKTTRAETIAVSPLSMFRLLGAVHVGARLESASRIESTLHIDQIPPDQFYIGMTSFQRNTGTFGINFKDSSRINFFPLTPLRPEWMTTIKGIYDVDVQNGKATIISKSPSKKRKARPALWSGLTNDKRQDMGLYSSVSCHGVWEKGFDFVQTSNQPFYTYANQLVTIPMMQRTGRYAYLKGNGFQAVSMPLAGGRVSVYLFMPDHSLGKFYSRLNTYTWERWMLLFEPKMGTVRVPRLSIVDSSTINEAFMQLGAGYLFTDRAYFGGIGDFPKLSKIESVVSLYLDESGQAPVAEVMNASIADLKEDPPFLLIFNRPFFYAVRDTLTGAILVMGMYGGDGSA